MKGHAMSDEWVTETYARYEPELVDAWERQQYDFVVNELNGRPRVYTVVFCCDIIASSNTGTKDEKLSRLAAAFLKTEHGFDPIQLEQQVEQLNETWLAGGEPHDQDVYESVAKQLIDKPRSALVTFVSSLFNPEQRMQAFFDAGILSGALMKVERAAVDLGSSRF